MDISISHQPIPHEKPSRRAQPFAGFTLRESDEELLDQLTPHHQALLRCHGSYGDLAERFGIPIGTLRSRLHRARAALSQLRQSRSNKEEPPSEEPAQQCHKLD
jgi:hypothetical protein